MLKRLTALLLLVFLPCWAFAETFSGTVVAADVEQITAPSSGTLMSLNLTQGQYINNGEECGSVGATKVFAKADGTVDRVDAEVGQEKNGTVLEVAPISRYTVYCTSSEAYEDENMNLIHIGETLWIKCTKDGTHLAKGTVTSISGETYYVEVNAGELYVGEAVWLYRDADYTDEMKAGKGTVTQPDNEVYTANGYILTLRVQEGDNVERGELLYTTSDAESNMVTSVCSGIVTEVNVSQGSEVKQNDVIAKVAQSVQITFMADEEQLDKLKMIKTVTFVRSDDASETRLNGTITGILEMSDGSGYQVTVEPDSKDLPIGMNLEIYTED